jgi:hypothetical protein
MTEFENTPVADLDVCKECAPKVRRWLQHLYGLLQEKERGKENAAQF